jgi:hypothetical protein
MIVLFTDFGISGPYIGQMKAAIHPIAPLSPLIDLFADAPSFDPVAAGYLLAAYVSEFAAGTVFLCVVDPGVGSSSRRSVVAEVDGCYFVGPDNGLFDVVARRACFASKREIIWRPQRLSDTFHGRDLFAPVAARIATNTLSQEWLADAEPFTMLQHDDELARLIYIDSFGNAMTGIRAATLSLDQRIEIGGMQIGWAKTFSDVERGRPFWYENANGLVELAVNCGSAAMLLSLSLGDEVKVL